LLKLTVPWANALTLKAKHAMPANSLFMLDFIFMVVYS
jgi:hypothetical protein